MTIMFEPGREPTQQELLDEAAGVEIQFEPGSLQETRFLHFCRKLYSVGYRNAMDLFSDNQIGTKS